MYEEDEEEIDDGMFDLVELPDGLLDVRLGDDWDNAEKILIDMLGLDNSDDVSGYFYGLI